MLDRNGLCKVTGNAIAILNVAETYLFSIIKKITHIKLIANIYRLIASDELIHS